ncbi:transmembrane protein 230-like [Oppia nitens]|uniref:transmembrane protein 230-like n=1 Tax=Oppia nitens TaxID=1686743 RepID=UPI0023DB3314|nr:transmembrane protein 230-like [Oppia nitens]
MSYNWFSNQLTHRLVNKPSKDVSDYQLLHDFCDQNNKQVSESRRIPWRAICLALFLLVFGTAIIVISILIYLRVIVNIKPNDGLLVLVLLGVIMFIPGFYHIRIAYYAYHRCYGYSFDDIPDFD